MDTSAARELDTALVISTDAGYLLPAGVLLRSIGSLLTDGEPLDVIVLHEDLGAEQLAQLRSVQLETQLRLLFHAVRVQDRHLPLLEHQGSHAGYLRLLLAREFPSLRRAVYMDADMVALRDIRELFSTPLDGRAVAAVQDPLYPVFSSAHVLNGHPLKQSAPSCPYLNSGLLVMDLAEWRAREISERAFEFMRTNPDSLLYCDQDALNGVLAGDWTALDPRWNALPFRELSAVSGVRARVGSIARLRELITIDVEAYVVHYAGPVKPWHDSWRGGPNAARFQRHLRPGSVPAS